VGASSRTEQGTPGVARVANIGGSAQFRRLWRRKWVVITPIVLLPIAVFLISSDAGNVYVAETTLQPLSLPSSQTQGPAQELAAAAIVAETSETLQRASKKLKRRPASVLTIAEEVEVQARTTAGLLTIRVKDPSAARAADIANAVATALIETRAAHLSSQLDDQIKELTALLETVPPSDTVERPQILNQLRRLKALRRARGKNALIVERARPPLTSERDRALRNTSVAVFMGVLIGVGIAVLLEYGPREEAGDISTSSKRGSPTQEEPSGRA
jgi:capsular polysaccharide biosynthesis protein